MKFFLINLLALFFGWVIGCALAMGNGIQPWIAVPVQPAVVVPGTPTPAAPSTVFVPIQPTPTIFMVPRTPVYIPARGVQRTGGMRRWIFGDVIRW
jgi:hypothetical protein